MLDEDGEPTMPIYFWNFYLIFSFFYERAYDNQKICTHKQLRTREDGEISNMKTSKVVPINIKISSWQSLWSKPI